MLSLSNYQRAHDKRLRIRNAVLRLPASKVLNKKIKKKRLQCRVVDNYGV